MFYIENTWENELREVFFTSRGFVVVFESCMIYVQIMIPIDGVVLWQPQRDLKPFCELITQRKTCGFINSSYKMQAFWRLFLYFWNALKHSYVVITSSYYLSTNESFMTTSSVVLCDFPNTSNCKLKSMKRAKDFRLRGVRNRFVVLCCLILCSNLSFSSPL